jgi:hypothetical protein
MFIDENDEPQISVISDRISQQLAQMQKSIYSLPKGSFAEMQEEKLTT